MYSINTFKKYELVIHYMYTHFFLVQKHKVIILLYSSTLIPNINIDHYTIHFINNAHWVYIKTHSLKIGVTQIYIHRSTPINNTYTRHQVSH